MPDDARPTPTADDTAQVLLDLSRELSELVGPREIAARLAAAVPTVIPVDASAVLLVDRENDLLDVAGMWGWPDDLAEAVHDFTLPLDASPTVRRAIDDFEPLLVTMDFEDPLIATVLKEFETQAALVVPLSVRGEGVGLVAGLQRGGRDEAISPALAKRLQGVAEIAARALENARLYSELDDHRNVLAHLLDSGPVVSFRGTTRGWSVTYVSQNVRRVLGHPPDSFLGSRWLEFVHPDDRDHAWNNIERVRQEPGVEFALRFRDADDRWRHVRVNLRVDPDDSPDDREILGYLWDESDRREAEDRYRLVSELTSDLAYALRVDDQGGVTVDWNTDGIEALTGYSLEELISLGGMRTLLAPDDLARFDAAIAALLAGDDLADLYRIETRAGEERWLELAARVTEADGDTIRVVGAARDVTDRKRAEDRLAESEARLRQLVEESPTAIVATKADGTVTQWNPAAERTFGWSSDEVVGRMLPTVPEGRLDSEIERVAPAFDAGQPLRNVRTKSVRRDGTVIDTVFSAAPILDAAGQLTGIISVVEDVSERNRLEEELRQAQKMNAIGRLAGGVAHDFNNILTTILGHAEFLLEEPLDAEAVVEGAEAIRHAAERAGALTEQLLMFSRHRAPETEVLDLNDVVESMHAMLKRLIGENIAFTIGHRVDSALVRASRSHLEQVVLNLVVNAGEAMPDGGTLTVETCAATLADGEAEAVGLVVADSGVGMDQEVRERLFEPFFTTRESGVGLGLAVVYGIVDSAGGDISVDSEVGRGTTIVVKLPRATARPDERSDAAVPAVSATSGRILLVEDEAEVRAVARETLVRNGYEVVEAADALEALAHFDTERFDLLVTDLVMPHMGGEELSVRLRDRDADLRVLFVSGYSETMPDTAGGDGRAFLQKPFTPEALLAAVRRTLSDTVDPVY